MAYVRPGTSRQLTLCGSACVQADVAEQECARAAQKVARDNADAGFRAVLREAASCGALVGFSLDGEQADAVGVLGGPPRGLSAGAWPIAGDEPMLHLATVDLRKLPLEGETCMGVFVQAFRERGSWSVGGELRVLPVAGLDLDAALVDLDPKRVPLGLLGSRFLYTTTTEPDFGAESAIASFAGGAPVDFEGRPYEHGRSDGDRFVAQISARLFDVRGADFGLLFEEVAGLYVFERSADLATYG